MVAGSLWLFARAFHELQSARSAQITADVSRETLRASQDAVEEIRGHRNRLSREEEPRYPTDDELREAARVQTLEELEPHDGMMPERYPTVEDNEARMPSPNGESSIPRDLLYVPDNDR